MWIQVGCTALHSAAVEVVSAVSVAKLDATRHLSRLPPPVNPNPNETGTLEKVDCVSCPGCLAACPALPCPPTCTHARTSCLRLVLPATCHYLPTLPDLTVFTLFTLFTPTLPRPPPRSADPPDRRRQRRRRLHLCEHSASSDSTHILSLWYELSLHAQRILYPAALDTEAHSRPSFP